jgi:hypothetical protein
MGSLRSGALSSVMRTTARTGAALRLVDAFLLEFGGFWLWERVRVCLGPGVVLILCDAGCPAGGSGGGRLSLCSQGIGGESTMNRPGVAVESTRWLVVR